MSVRQCRTCGTLGKRGVERFAKRVFGDYRLLRGWKMGWVSVRTDAGECCHDLKLILVAQWNRTCRPWQAMEYVLHEIAHAFVGLRRWPYDPHDKEFYRVYIRLLRRYMEREAPDGWWRGK